MENVLVFKNYVTYLIFKSKGIINFEYILPDLHVKLSKQTLTTCVKWLFNHAINDFYCRCPVDIFFLAALSIFGGFAWRARWCWKASHSEAWIYLGSTFVIPYCWRERQNLFFHMFMLFFFAYRFVQMVLWTLFTLGCYPRCFENWWVNTVCMLRFKKYDSFKNKIQFILGSIFPSGLCIYIYLFIYSYIVYIVYFPQQFCFHINKWKNTKATLI